MFSEVSSSSIENKIPGETSILHVCLAQRFFRDEGNRSDQHCELLKDDER